MNLINTHTDMSYLVVFCVISVLVFIGVIILLSKADKNRKRKRLWAAVFFIHRQQSFSLAEDTISIFRPYNPGPVDSLELPLAGSNTSH